MEPDGRYRVLAHGMQSNGTIAARTGNLIVCDMFGHRVVELDPADGRVLRVLLDRINGRPIDGWSPQIRVYTASTVYSVGP